LGEFLPNGPMFIFGSFLKIKKSSKNNWAICFQSKSYVLIMAKNGLGYILGDFFKNSSGHHPHKKIKSSEKKVESIEKRSNQLKKGRIE
jgi:hypothetical protein